MRKQITTFVVIVVAIFVGLFLYDEYRAKRPVDDFGVGKAHERSRIIKSDFVRASDPAKTALAEFYANSGKWPASNKDAGLPEPDAYHGESLKTLTVDESKITMTFDDKVGPSGGTIVLNGTYAADTFMVRWTCVTPNIPDISAIIPFCRYTQ